MNIKTDISMDNIFYIEASSLYPPVRRSYAEMAKEMVTLPNIFPPPLTQLPSLPNRSYCQMVTHYARPVAALGKGYDIQAHQSIAGDIPSCPSNVCELNNPHSPLTLIVATY